MAKNIKKIDIYNHNEVNAIVAEQVLRSGKRLVVKLADGTQIEMPFKERNCFNEPYFSNGTFYSWGHKYTPRGSYIVEDSQDFIDAMKAA